MVTREEQKRIDEANSPNKQAPKPATPLGTGPQPDTPTPKYHDPIPPVGAPGTSGTPLPPMTDEEKRRLDQEQKSRR